MARTSRILAASVALVLVMSGPALAAVCAVICTPDAHAGAPEHHPHGDRVTAQTQSEQVHVHTAPDDSGSPLFGVSREEGWSAWDGDCWSAVTAEASSETASRGGAHSTLGTTSRSRSGTDGSSTHLAIVTHTASLPPVLGGSLLALRI